MINSNELLASHKILSLLEEGNRNTEKILDNLPSIFVVLNEKNQVIRANQAFCQLLGVDMDAALHTDFMSIFDADQKKVAQHYIDKIRAGDVPPGGVQFRSDIAPPGKAQDMQYLWVMTPMHHNVTADGELVAVVGENFSSVYQSEMKLMNIFESIPLAILILDANGLIEDVLSKFSEILFESTDLIGQSIPSLVFKHMTSNHKTQDHKDLVDSFERLITTAGKPKENFANLEHTYIKLFSMRAKYSSTTKWMKASYQAVTKNELVDKFMVILQDETETVGAIKERERVKIIEQQSLALYQCAIQDPLTGLYTRLYMKDGVNTLLNAYQRGNIKALELCIFDLDNFKKINDQYGHVIGDKVLSAVGEVILKCSNPSNIAVRYGGEEIVVVLPEEEEEVKGSSKFAEQVREGVEAISITLDSGEPLTVTISGGSAYCQRGENLEQLIARADRYLYMAKDAGKNRIVSEHDVEAT